uniref:Uncharacterized protein n=1 Tax=Corethron hystrix TaxID=216773 RepID=A0A7S1B6L7_9STRA|mmetsp:Transcript_1344/g.2719  ORF Transcript_1344/g.2719 Transcript_1344/m.2719 type:complete len:123 (+) Transcript_1344:64-432(+)
MRPNDVSNNPHSLDAISPSTYRMAPLPIPVPMHMRATPLQDWFSPPPVPPTSDAVRAPGLPPSVPPCTPGGAPARSPLPTDGLTAVAFDSMIHILLMQWVACDADASLIPYMPTFTYVKTRG